MNTEQKKRLKKISGMSIGRGGHKSIDTGMCVMEAVAYVAGEKWSASPACTSAIIASFLRGWNDSLNDEDRNHIMPSLIPILISTASDEATEDIRFWMIIDWLIREFTPPWLDLAGLTMDASALRSLAEISDPKGIKTSIRAIQAAKINTAAAWDAASGAAARDAARASAWDAASGGAARDAAWAASSGAAAGDAAWGAARDAARDASSGAAAWDAAWDVAEVAASAAARDARDAAWDAAEVAASAAARDARAAAWDAAWDAVGKKFRPTVELLQKSAVKLIKRMVALSSKGKRT